MGSSKFGALVLAALAIAGVAVAPSTATAQSSTAQAETLFRQGQDLLLKGKIAEACAAFDASQKLDPTIATLLNQASCREKNGQLATAWGLFLDAERQSRSASDEAGRKLHQVAVDHAAKIEPRLSTLTITVASENRIGGLEILRNAEPVDPGAWNKALPVDAGTYNITARAPGNAEWSSTITVGVERDARSIEIPKLKAAALVSHPAAAPGPAGSAPGSAATASRPLLVPLIVGVAALGLGGTAIGFEVSASSTYDKSVKATTAAEQSTLFHSANNKRYAAEGLGAAGVVAAGAAVYLYLRGGQEAAPASASAGSASRGSRTTSRIIVAPIIGGDRAGLLLQGSY